MNPISNTVFKLKFRGQKVEVRVMDDGERINPRCIQRSFAPFGYAISGEKEKEVSRRNDTLVNPEIINLMKEMTWDACNCVGEKNNEHNHHHRVYLEVLSPGFMPVSDDSMTEPQDKGKAGL